MSYSSDTLVATLTVGQLQELINEALRPSRQQRIVYGLDGVCQVLHIGKTKASMCRKSGLLDEACLRKGNNAPYDVDKLIEIAKGL